MPRGELACLAAPLVIIWCAHWFLYGPIDALKRSTIKMALNGSFNHTMAGWFLEADARPGMLAAACVAVVAYWCVVMLIGVKSPLKMLLLLVPSFIALAYAFAGLKMAW